MGSKFLGGDDIDLTALQDGTFSLNCASAILQNLSPSLPVKTSATKQLTSGQIQVADCAFVPLTNPATSDLDLASNDITDINQLMLEANASPSTPAINNLTIYEAGDKLRYKDSAAATFQVATTTDIASYLPLGGGTMSGTLNMGAQNLTNVGSITTNALGFLIGSGSTLAPVAGSITIGSTNTASTGIGGPSLITGYSNDASPSTNGQSIIYGYGNTDGNTSGGSFIFGLNNTNGTGARNVILGRNNTVSNGVTEGFVIGFNNTNSTSNSLLVGGTAQANIRAGSTICDLGTTGNPFQNAYLNAEVKGATAYRVAATNIIIGNTATASSTNGVVIGDGATIVGVSTDATVMGSGATANAALRSVAIGKNSAALGTESTAVGHASSAGASGQNTALGKSSIISGTGASSVAVGYGSLITGGTFTTVCGANSTADSAGSVILGGNSTSTGAEAHVIGSSAANTTPGSCLIYSTVNIRATNTCDLGTVATPFQSIFLNANISGATNSRSADNIVSNAGASTSGNLPSLTGTTGKVITDSGIVALNVVNNSGGLATSGHLVQFSGTTGRLITGAGAALSSYLPLAGGTMTGPLNMGSQAITAATTIACTRIDASTPACYSGGIVLNSNVSFTAATSKLIDSGTLTQLSNPSSLFTATASTGKITYTGTPTRWFRCICKYSINPPANTEILYIWLSKNGSLTSITTPNAHNFTAAVLSTTPYEASYILQLATNDTVQLAGYYTATASVLFHTIEYQLIPIS